jgi:tetratricopeptide (TPR) repeat protein
MARGVAGPPRSAQQKRPKRERPERTEPRLAPPLPPAPPGTDRRSFLIQALVIVVLTFVAHSSSLRNQYALDDELIILRNIPVQRGISGIGEILTTDVFASYFESMGGEAPAVNKHYRPLSIITFAIEQSLFGRALGDEYRAVRAEWNRPGSAGGPELEARLLEAERKIDEANREIAFHRHFVQLLLYAGSAVLLLLFLQRCVFPTMPGAAFVTTLLFALHPIHSEIVSNIKSRDEILSLLFILATGIFFFAWDRTRKWGAMALALAALALALLTKEYAVVAPVIFGALLMLVRGRRLREAVVAVIPLFAVVVLFMIVRQPFVAGGVEVDLASRDILIDPFLKLRTGEAEGSILATKIDIIDHYLRLLVVPHPLSSDYGYAWFSYQTWASPTFWLSLLLHAVLIALTLLAWRRRHVLAFAGIVYFGFLLLVQIGATMGERLIYHSSLGFALLLGWSIAKLPRVAAVVACVAIAVPYGIVTFARDQVWKDNRTLFLTDVKTVPRSALLNGNAGQQIVNEALERIRERNRSNVPLAPADREFIRARAAEGLVYLERAVKIHDRHAGAWMNIGIAHYYREEWDAAGKAFARAAVIAPGRPALRQYATNFQMLGTALARKGDLAGAIDMFGRAAAASPDDLRFQTDYATAAFMDLRFAESRAAFEKALAIDPSNAQAARGVEAASEFDRLTRATIERPNDAEAFAQLAAQLARNPDPRFAAAAERARATSARLRGDGR